MTEEIGRLGLLVNEFDHPFHPHPGFLKTYKKVFPASSSFVRACVGSVFCNLETPLVRGLSTEKRPEYRLWSLVGWVQVRIDHLLFCAQLPGL